MSDSQLLEAMIGAAIEAGRAAYAIYRRGFQVLEKADASPVTDADHASEAIILERLAACASATPIVAEEAAAAGQIPAAAEEFFLVDPLDGTREFIAGRGEFTVNIALVRGGAPALGVVYAPALGQLFAGDAPSGHAFVSDLRAQAAGPREPIRVRRAPEAGLTAVASRSHSTPETDAYLARYAVGERVSVGSSLKFCLVAQGRADLYPRLGPTMEWDTAAGHAVLLGAGGTVVAPDGEPLRYGKPQYRNPWFIASGSLVPLPISS
ncbi:MAG: 3'(2'),5'-bisphosphate nucleotidase CysQ [Steroidobacteraceae bacterium]